MAEYDIEDFGRIIYEQMVENERAGRAIGIFQQFFGCPLDPVVLGEREYVRCGDTIVETGQDIVDEQIVGPKMLQDRGRAPALEPSNSVWRSIEDTAQGLRDNIVPLREAGGLLDDYDMTRLRTPEEHIFSSYTATVMQEIEKVESVREPPKWVLAMARKDSAKKLKIGTRSADRYAGYGYKCQDYSNEDLVLSSTLTSFKIGVFLNPAYYRKERKLDIYDAFSGDVYEMNYTIKDKFQRRYMSRDPRITYEPSNLGPETLIAYPYTKPAIEGAIAKSCTDFFFTRPKQHGHLSYFQHLPPVYLSTSKVFRKSTVTGVYQGVRGLGYHFATDTPLPARVRLKKGQIYLGEELIKFGNRFVYKIRSMSILSGDDPGEKLLEVDKFNKKFKYELGALDSCFLTYQSKRSRESLDFSLLKKPQEEECWDQDEYDYREQIAADAHPEFEFENRYDDDLSEGSGFEDDTRDKEIELSGLLELRLIDSAILPPQMLVYNEDLKTQMDPFIDEEDELDPWEEKYVDVSTLDNGFS